MHFVVGTRVGPYEILQQVAPGALATVYRARDTALDRDVAIKVLQSSMATDSSFRERFERAAAAIARLRHSSIVAVFDFGEEQGLPYLVTEFVDGGSLADHAGERWPVEEVVRIVRPIADALDYAHSVGVVHGDVKPGNILLWRDERPPVLTDFALGGMVAARSQVSSLDGSTLVTTPQDVRAPTLVTQPGEDAATLAYLAPELATGERAAGPETDQYALAALASELMTGRLPTPASARRGATNVAGYTPSPSGPALSAAVESVVARAMAVDPAARYPSVSAFVDALDHAAAAPVVITAPPPPPDAPPAPATTPRPVAAPVEHVAAPAGAPSRWLPVAIAIPVVALLALAVLWWRFSPTVQRTQPPATGTPTVAAPLVAAAPPIVQTVGVAVVTAIAPPTAMAEPTQTPEPTATTVPTQTPEPTATAVPTAQPIPTPGCVMLPATPDDPRACRLEESSPAPDRYVDGYQGDEYVIKKLSQDTTVINAYLGAVAEEYTDVAISVDTRLVGATDGRYIVLACRVGSSAAAAPPDSLYELLVNPGAGVFSLQRYVAGSVGNLIAGRPAPSIKRGNEANHVEFRCVGNTISAHINGVEVAHVTDDALHAGKATIGVAKSASVAGTAEARFRNLTVGPS